MMRVPNTLVVQCAVAFPDMRPVRTWLRERLGSAPRSDAQAAEQFLRAFLHSNACWSRIPLDVRCDAPISPKGVSL